MGEKQKSTAQREQENGEQSNAEAAASSLVAQQTGAGGAEGPSCVVWDGGCHRVMSGVCCVVLSPRLVLKCAEGQIV